MKIRHTTSGAPEKVDMQMTPMIDIVFQLLTFFLFSFKIVAPEGDFNIKMPVAAPNTSNLEDPTLPIKVRLTANPDGTLSGIQMNDRGITRFEELHRHIIGIVSGAGGPDEAADTTEVEIDADYHLKYRYVVDAITAVSGYVTEDGNTVKLVQKIRFSPPKKPSS